MKVSVIIPTYKPKDYLWECLDSIASQTFPYKDFEVILVLNGCSEPWKSDIEKYIVHNMQGMNINFIQLDQGGVSNARNVALDNVQGEYVTFIDDDDFVSPTFLEELYDKAAPDVVSLCYAYAFIDGDVNTQLCYRITDEFTCRSKFGKQHYQNARKNFSGPCMKLLHISVLRDRKYDLRFKNGEDSLYMFLISDKFKFVDFTSANAIYYRRFRENSAVTTKRSRKEIIMNGLRLVICYCKIYFSSPCNYSFMYFITRLMGTFKSMII